MIDDRQVEYFKAFGFLVLRNLFSAYEVFPVLADAADKHDAESRLRGPVGHADFRRLT